MQKYIYLLLIIGNTKYVILYFISDTLTENYICGILLEGRELLTNLEILEKI